MRYWSHNTVYRSIIIYILFYSYPYKCLCQVNKAFSLRAGTVSYLGELSPYNVPIKSIFSLAVRWNFAASYQQSITKQLSIRTELTYARLFGDDNLFEIVKPINYLRNLHFRNDIKQLSLDMVYSFNENSKNYKREIYTN